MPSTCACGGKVAAQDAKENIFLPREAKIVRVEKTTEAERMSADLKKRGFRFVGPTICYAHMQATGMVNDHSLACYRRKEVMALVLPAKAGNK